MSHFWEPPAVGVVDGVQAVVRMCQCGTLEYINSVRPGQWTPLYKPLEDAQCSEYDRRVFFTRKSTE